MNFQEIFGPASLGVRHGAATHTDQCTFFIRIQVDIKEIAEGKIDICTLPIMLQMYPEVTILYDDDDFMEALPQVPSALKASEKVYAWRWLLSASRIYLFRWDPLKHASKVFREPDGNILRCMRRNYIPHRTKHFSSDKLVKVGENLLGRK